MISAEQVWRSMLRSMRMAAPAAVGVLCVTHAALGSASASISGVVSDATGRPIRGAIVRAEQDGKLIARYTGKDGRYQIPGLAPNNRKKMTASAFGFATTVQEIDGDKASFKLAAKMNLADMNSTELRYLIDDKDQTQRHVYYECGNCHGIELLVPRAGMPAQAWAEFLPHMSEYLWDENHFTPDWSATLGKWIEPLFGPNGSINPDANPDYSKIKHTPLVDSALKATITEYAIPAPADTLSYGAQAHSISVDQKTGLVWFGAYDTRSNSIVKFDPATESFRDYKIPLYNSAPHTGTVMADGTYVIGLHKRKYSPFKLAMVGRNDKVEMIEWPGRPRGGRVVVTDPSDPEVIWAVSDWETWRINMRTNDRRVYQNPKPPALPDGSFVKAYGWPHTKPIGNGYAMGVDSKGVAWVSQMYQAMIFSIDPASGVTKMYNDPQMTSARGLIVDRADNIWFADFYGHKLGMLDPKTGKVTMYEAPNKYSAPYGLTLDPQRGHIWYADLMANNATRFDPKTKQFVEYPLPTARASHRFMGIDPQGRAWYGGFFNGKLGVIDPGDKE